MRVIFSLDKYEKSEGGADKLAKGIVNCLLENGHTVRVVQGGNEKSFYDSGNLQIHSYPLKKSRLIRDNDYMTLKWNCLWPEVLLEEVNNFKPDIMLTQNMLAPASVYVAKQKGIKSIIFFHGYKCISPLFFFGQDALTADEMSFYGMPLKHKLKWPLVKKTLELYNKAYKAANMVIANSNYVAKVIERFFQRDAEVLYPVIDMDLVDKAPAYDNSKDILFVKPQEIKGVEIFFEVAQAAKDRKFTVVGSASRRMKLRFSNFENINYIPWTDDMDSVYSNSSLLFGPSQIPEPFGRVFVEAGMRYIPSVATNGGGIPEAVGLGGELVRMDAKPDEWINTIEKVLSENKYKSYCDNSRKHSEQILTVNNAGRFLKIIDDLFC